jgi:hypothetical protein
MQAEFSNGNWKAVKKWEMCYDGYWRSELRERRWRTVAQDCVKLLRLVLAVFSLKLLLRVRQSTIFCMYRCYI